MNRDATHGGQDVAKMRAAFPKCHHSDAYAAYALHSTSTANATESIRHWHCVFHNDVVTVCAAAAADTKDNGATITTEDGATDSADTVATYSTIGIDVTITADSDAMHSVNDAYAAHTCHACDGFVHWFGMSW